MMNPIRCSALRYAMALVLTGLALSSGGCVLATGAAAGLSGHGGGQSAEDDTGPIRPAPPGPDAAPTRATTRHKPIE
ncbi:MAG: hypothetical protein CMP08_08835 [Xanthomonadales bacterium]|nr:hypothetical protein [Xanthomonadales bacterium]|tara:strand:- start:2222 stop:2452 length:231 start_codon:yes stop_codon:yes gene_type:complete